MRLVGIGRKRMRWCAALALQFLTALSLPAQPGILGVLEDVPPRSSGDTERPMIRVLFRFDGNKWASFPNDCQNQDCLRRIISEYPSHARWFVGFNGHELAKLTSHAPADFEWYANVGLEEVDQKSQSPKIGSKSEDFGGFTGDAVYRPLVANSGPFFTDPEGWKRAAPPRGIQDAFRTAFRHKSPKFCSESEDGETPAAPIKYENSQVQITKAYKSIRGTWIAEIHLNDPRACEYDRWFVVGPDGLAAYLDEGVFLVDAGDFNNDGKSEILFSISRYDRGGYELFYDQFTKHVAFEFSFH